MSARYLPPLTPPYQGGELLRIQCLKHPLLDKDGLGAVENTNSVKK